MAPEWSKRHLIYGSAGMAASGMMNSQGSSESDEEETAALSIRPRDTSGTGNLRAAVIGHTGAGDFGHGLDKIFANVAGVEVVAVSDSNEEALSAAKSATEADEAYANFEEMLAKEKPDLVSIASRWPDQHFAMAKAALLGGAHLLVEKPFTLSLAEADELLAMADHRELKIAVAHQMRCNPVVLRFLDLRHRLIGELLEMRVYGKMDDRAGGEDMLVSGTPLFDLVRLFAGEVEYCTARIRSGGRDATIADVHESEFEKLGPLLGDDICAQFAMDSGINVTFLSRKKMREVAAPWGIEFIGTKSKARLFAGESPVFSVLQSPDPRSADRQDVWKTWPEPEPESEEETDNTPPQEKANQKLVKNWLLSIAKDKEPLSSGYRAMKALEMAHGVWEAGLTGGRVRFPLVDRETPLNLETDG